MACSLLILLGLSADFLEPPAMLFHQLTELNLEGIYSIKESLNPIRLPAHPFMVNINAEVLQHLVGSA